MAGCNWLRTTRWSHENKAHNKACRPGRILKQAELGLIGVIKAVESSFDTLGGEGVETA
ncbi:hypothetical protein O9992_30755 [Vibrio lentus]|nr:hypothetical protein [Vibrio lentus]